MVAARLRLQLLLDEGLPKRQSFPLLNDRANVRHIKHDYHKAGSRDDSVYAIANADQRIVVTLNLYDFQQLLQPSKSSVIGISPALSVQQIDSKIVALLGRLQPHHLKGHYFKIGRDTRVSDLV